MRAKPNGHNGPDELDAGMPGFEALTIHQHAPLPVLNVREGSAAATAGLKSGDLILSLNGVDLPVSTCAPGFAWFERSHEAVLGRAVLASMAADGTLSLGILRNGKERQLQLKLPRRGARQQFFPME